jgi:hypothetical protein
LKKWWQTDCQFCLKYRRMFIWLIIMIAIDALWFNLLF